MEIIERFEYPLPVLTIDTESINIEISSVYEGSFKIKNTGGGSLSGNIISGNKSITFIPESFNTNSLTVFYSINTKIYKTGDVINTSVVIMSNGGEKIIPIEIVIIPPAITVSTGALEEIKIATLKDFMLYARSFPLAARQFLSSGEFRAWLVGTGYEHLEVYDFIVKDANKERAMENFLIMSGLKKKAELMVIDNKVSVNVNQKDKRIYDGVIKIQKTTWGYAEAVISNDKEYSWLRLGTDKITSSDFDVNDVASFHFYIEPWRLTGRLARAVINISSDILNTSLIEVKVQPSIQVSLSKESFGLADTGKIIIRNNTGGDMQIDISSKDSYIKFEGRKYFVSEYAEIPFEVKLTAIQSAQLIIKKQPCLYSEIYVRTGAGSGNIVKKLPVTVGEL